MQPTGTWKYAKIVRCEHILLRQVQRLLSFSALSSSSASSTLLLLTRQLILDGLVGWLVGPTTGCLPSFPPPPPHSVHRGDDFSI